MWARSAHRRHKTCSFDPSLNPHSHKTSMKYTGRDQFPHSLRRGNWGCRKTLISFASIYFNFPSCFPFDSPLLRGIMSSSTALPRPKACQTRWCEVLMEDAQRHPAQSRRCELRQRYHAAEKSAKYTPVLRTVRKWDRPCFCSASMSAAYLGLILQL